MKIYFISHKIGLILVFNLYVSQMNIRNIKDP